MNSNNCSTQTKNGSSKHEDQNGDESKLFEDEKQEVVSLEPPDGGWGWMVALGTCFLTASLVMPASVFGILYFDAFMKSGVSTKTIAWIFSIQQAMWSFSPIFASPLCAMYGYRKVAFTGGFLGGTSIILSGFSINPVYMFVTYSLLYGIAFTPCVYIIPQYFEKYRGRTIGLMMAAIGISFFFTPMIVIKLQEEYGNRWAIFIVGAIMLNGCVAACLFHPIEWHAKSREEKNEGDPTSVLVKNNTNGVLHQSLEEPNWSKTLSSEIKVGRIKRLSECSIYSLESLKRSSTSGSFRKSEIPSSKYLLEVPNEEVNDISRDSVIEEEKKSLKAILSHEAKLRRVKFIRECSLSSFNSTSELSIPNRMLKDFEAETNNSNTTKNISNKDISVKSQFINYFKSIGRNFSLLKSHRIKLIITSLALLNISNLNSQMMIPFLMMENNHSMQDSSWILSLYAIGSTISRLGVSVLIDKLHLSNRYYFMFGSLWTSVSIFALTIACDLRWFSIASFSFGFGFGTCITLNTVIIIEFMGMELLSDSYCLTTFIMSIILLTSGPIVGLIRDISESYNFTLKVLSIVAFMSFLLYFLMPLAQRSDKRRRIAQLPNRTIPRNKTAI